MNNNIVNKEDTNFKKKTDEELRKKIGKNIDQCRCGTDCCKRFTSTESSHNNNVHCIEH